MNIHWFNPDNDLALASGLPRYTPPKAAALLRDAGAALPLWYGDEGDAVLCYGVEARWYDRVCADFGLPVGLFDHQPVEGQMPRPWGWSAAARTFFLDEGFAEESLPTDDEIAVMRQLSHRRTAARIAEALRRELPDVALAVPAVEVDDVARVAAMIADSADLYLKSPWSSSGRGVVSVADVGADKALRMAADTIRRQGSVMVERAYAKRIDFARLYHSDGRRCHCLGTSVFDTDARGSYTGNLVADEAQRIARVGQWYPLRQFERIDAALGGILDSLVAPHYRGIFGIDMLVAEDGTLDATVELNLRHTMGYVALRLADRYLAPGLTATFSVSPRREGQPAAATASYQSKGNRLVAGTLHLTPPGAAFAFTLTVK